MTVSRHTAQAFLRPTSGPGDAGRRITAGSPSRYASAAVVLASRWAASRWHPSSKPLRTHQATARPRSSFAFPHSHGSPNSLAMKDQSDVGPLSCRVTLKPVSIPLQDDLRFFRPPKPASPWAYLAVYRPGPKARSDTGFPRSAPRSTPV